MSDTYGAVSSKPPRFIDLDLMGRVRLRSFYAVSDDELRKTIVTVASYSSTALECAEYLDMLGINIEEVHSASDSSNSSSD